MFFLNISGISEDISNKNKGQSLDKIISETEGYINSSVS